MLVDQKADGGLNKGQLKQGPVVVTNEDGKTAPKLADAAITVTRHCHGMGKRQLQELFPVTLLPIAYVPAR